MVANIGPASYNYDETITTLRYANRAKNIKNKPKINEDPKDAILREYQQELARLKVPDFDCSYYFLFFVLGVLLSLLTYIGWNGEWAFYIFFTRIFFVTKCKFPEQAQLTQRGGKKKKKKKQAEGDVDEAEEEEESSVDMETILQQEKDLEDERNRIQNDQHMIEEVSFDFLLSSDCCVFHGYLWRIKSV